MNPSSVRKNVHFENYYEKGDDRKRLTVVLLAFALVICPVFALLFHRAGVPSAYFYIVLSGSWVFPIVILLERYVTFLRGKMPRIYFVYFLSLTIYAVTDLKKTGFDAMHFTFFTGLFSILNFGLQRFWLSLAYSGFTFLLVTLAYVTSGDSQIEEGPSLILFACIAIFYLVMYYSRNRMINSIQDHNDYLRLIVNNSGNGFVLFQILQEEIVLVDYNGESLKLFDTQTFAELEKKIRKLWTIRERRRIRSLMPGEHYHKRFNQVEKSAILDIKIIPLKLQNGQYLLATIMDVTRQTREQDELSKEVLRAELAEETSKRLAREIEERINAETKLQAEFLRTKAIFDSSSNTFLLTLNTEMCFSTFNTHCRQYFEAQTGIPLKEGTPFEDFFHRIFSPLQLRYFRILMQRVRTGSSYQLEISFVKRTGETSWLEIFINPIYDTGGSVAEISLVSHDITEKKHNEGEIMQSLKEKEVLLKEVHHRVKNNLQIISSILNLQSSFITDEKIVEIIEESRHRIRSMAIIHENLYRTTNFSSIHFSDYVRELAGNLIASYQFNKSVKVKLKYEIEKVELNLDQAIPCGLIINEIITNSMKYAFNGNHKGTIFVGLKEEEGRVVLSVSDDGVGLPEGFDYLKSDSLGIQLIVTLIDQLDGEMEIDNSQGIKYLITFDKQKL